MTCDVLGLNEMQIELSRQKHGKNSFEKEKTRGFFRRFLENLNDPIIKVLIIALAVELIFTFKSCNLFEIFGIAVKIQLIPRASLTAVNTLKSYKCQLLIL